MRENFDDLGMLIVAILFGCAYSFQAIGAGYLSPFSFNIGKYVIATLTIFPLILRKTNTNLKKEIKYGLVIGILLFIFAYFAQVVADKENPGKIGFITTMYIVEVPVANLIFFKKKINLQTIISLIFALAGLALLCGVTDLSFKITDLYIIACSLLLCLEIIFIERYCKDCDAFKLNFFVCIFILIFSIIGCVITHEQPTLAAYKESAIPLLYVGLGCATIGCSLQNYCQKTLDATTCSLIMSLESVFSAISGYLILNQTMSKIEIIGCVLMFIGVLLCITSQKQKKSLR